MATKIAEYQYAVTFLMKNGIAEQQAPVYARVLMNNAKAQGVSVMSILETMPQNVFSTNDLNYYMMNVFGTDVSGYLGEAEPATNTDSFRKWTILQ